MIYSVLTTLIVTCVLNDIPLVECTCQSSVTHLTAQSTEGTVEEARSSNQDCQWYIDSSDHVELNVTAWSLVHDDYCSVDSLSIYDGNSDSALLLAKLCGSGSTRIMISSGHGLFVRLITIGSNTGSGVRFTYRSYGSDLPRCHTPSNEWPTRRYIRATTEEQIITSPNYPANYPVSTREEWVIEKSSAFEPLAIVILDMDIETSHYCGYDYLAVYYGECATTKLKAKICGTKTESKTLSTSSYVLIRFHSDSGKTGKGFKLKYYMGELEHTTDEKSSLHAILICLITVCAVIIFSLGVVKVYMKCFKKPKVRPNQTQLQNRRTMLEAQVRRGPLGSRLARMMTAQSIHAEMTRYLGNTEHDSRVSTFEISSSQVSGTGLVYEDGMYQPPSYSTLFRHAEEIPPPADSDMAPPPYPGSPEIKPEEDGGRGPYVSPSNPKRSNSDQDNNSILPPSYHAS